MLDIGNDSRVVAVVATAAGIYVELTLLQPNVWLEQGVYGNGTC